MIVDTGYIIGKPGNQDNRVKVIRKTGNQDMGARRQRTDDGRRAVPILVEGRTDDGRQQGRIHPMR